MGVRAGLLNRRITLERRIESKDTSGSVKILFEAIARVSARVQPLGGREAFGSQQFVATGDQLFTIRWRSDVNPLHRVTLDGREYDVTAVAEEGRETILITGRARTEERP